MKKNGLLSRYFDSGRIFFTRKDKYNVEYTRKEQLINGAVFSIPVFSGWQAGRIAKHKLEEIYYSQGHEIYETSIEPTRAHIPYELREIGWNAKEIAKDVIGDVNNYLSQYTSEFVNKLGDPLFDTILGLTATALIISGVAIHNKRVEQRLDDILSISGC